MKYVVTTTLDELLKVGEFPEDATLEEILEKIGWDKVTIVNGEDDSVLEE